jgi:hypothetical protein
MQYMYALEECADYPSGDGRARDLFVEESKSAIEVQAGFWANWDVGTAALEACRWAELNSGCYGLSS